MKDVHDVQRALATTHLFRGLAARGLEQISAIATYETLEPGGVIFNEGDEGNKLYVILEGKVRISRTLAGLGDEALAILGPGEAFGEMSLIDSGARSADAHVHQRCRLLVISREAFEDLLSRRKDLAYDILWNFVKILSQRLRETTDKMAFLSVTGRF